MRFFLFLFILILASCSGPTNESPSTPEEPTKDSSEVIVIPFELYDGLIFVPVQVGSSKSLHFLFDTGAGGTTVNSNAAVAEQIHAEDTVYSMGGDGMIKVPYIDSMSIVVGDAPLENIGLLFSDLTHLEQLSGTHIDGIIGTDLMGQYLVEVNYTHQELRLYTALGNDVNEDYGVPLPINLALGIPVVDMSCTYKDSAAFQGRFLFDTGAQAAIMLTTPTVERTAGIQHSTPTYRDRAKGANDSWIPVRVGQAQNILLTKFLLSKVPLVLSESETGALSMDLVDGVIGNKITSKFDFLLNYREEYIMLAPNDNASKPILTDGSGLRVWLKQGKVEVYAVVEGSPASEAGIETSDVLEKVDGKETSAYTLAAIKQLLKGENKKVRLALSRQGRTYEVDISLQTLY